MVLWSGTPVSDRVGLKWCARQPTCPTGTSLRFDESAVDRKVEGELGLAERVKLARARQAQAIERGQHGRTSTAAPYYYYWCVKKRVL